MTLGSGAQITIEYDLRRRRLHDLKEGYTPWIVDFTGNLDDILLERKAYLDGGYREDCLQVVKVTTIEEVQNV